MTILATSSAAYQVIDGALAFLVVAAMGVALFFLLRSMNKQLRKVVPEPQWRQAGAAKPGELGAEAGPGDAGPAA